MPVKCKISLLLLFVSHLFVTGICLFAQDVNQFSIDQGLSQSWVRCIHQDAKGFLWIGTQDGLNRYDGYDFKIFRHELYDTSSIGENTINSISEDQAGNLWIGTENGLSKYDRKREIFENFCHTQSNPKSISAGPVYQTLVDSTGAVWVKTVQFLEKLDPAKGEVERYDIFSVDPFSPPIDYIFPMIQDHIGRIWTGTNQGLYLFDPARNQYHRFLHEPGSPVSLNGDYIYSIMEDHKNRLWIGTTSCIHKFNPEDSTFQRFYVSAENNEDVLIQGLYNDPTGMFWVGTSSGIFFFDEANGKFTYFEKMINRAQIGGYFSFSTFIKDRSEIIWAGGSQGLFKCDKKGKKFSLYRNRSPNDPDFSSNGITAIFEGPGGLIWLGTWGAGLVLYDRNRNDVIRYFNENQNDRSRISDNVISSITRDREGTIWVGTENGVNIYREVQGGFIPFSKYANIPGCEEFDRMYVNHIYEDPTGILWFSTSEGWISYDKSTGSIVKFVHSPGNPNSLSNNFVYFTCQDKDRIFWIGTRQGLNRYDLVNNSFSSYQNNNIGIPVGISNNYVYYIHEGTDGYLWIGTGSGLNRFDKQTEQFTIYTEKSGLPNDLIYAILEDNNQNLWISTNRGLVKFNTRTEEIYAFDTSDGIQSLEFNIGAYYKSNRGEFFFGGMEGFNSFYPDSIKINPYPPALVLTSFQYLSANGWEEVPVEGEKVVIKTRETNMFAVEFAALEFTNPQKNQYQFFLEGLEETWQPQTTERRAVYSNLDAGNYIFRVKGTNDDLVWNEEEITLHITIKSAFWNSKVAYGFYLASILVLIYLFIHIRTSHLRKANRILQEKQKASLEIERQKEELSIKNKDITDSINYAKKIQEAMLPPHSYFSKLLPESFVFYRPKDIVSGDFYWINEKQDKVFVTAVDCTGHGVPGAFMSLIGFEILDKIINDQGIEQPAEILTILSKAIEVTFSQEEEDITLRDGMDIAFCVIDRKEGMLQFAGAFSPLYLLRDNTLTEIRGDRISVGISEGLQLSSFTNHVIPLEKDDVIYIFSDGYADQFGGPQGKKFMYRRFRHMLLTIHPLKMKDQKAFLEESIEGWMGNLDQVDDILIIGIKPLGKSRSGK